MMTLIAWQSVAYVLVCSYLVFRNGFLWELATLIVIMLLGHWLEMKSVLGASKALQLLVSMMPAEAHKVHGDHMMDVNLKNYKRMILFLSNQEKKFRLMELYRR
jgi:Cu2+-exporting ATPase